MNGRTNIGIGNGGFKPVLVWTGQLLAQGQRSNNRTWTCPSEGLYFFRWGLHQNYLGNDAKVTVGISVPNQRINDSTNSFGFSTSTTSLGSGGVWAVLDMAVPMLQGTTVTFSGSSQQNYGYNENEQITIWKIDDEAHFYGYPTT